MMNKDSLIYVAGHTGLLGSAVVRQLKAQGYKNLVLRTHTEMDLLKQEETYQFFLKVKPEFVFFCAARVGGIQANMDAPGSFLFENLQMECNAVEGARLSNVKKFLFVASTCVYPPLAPQPFREESLFSGPCEATNEGYAIAKLTGVKLCQTYRKQYGLDMISAVPTNLYGIYDNYDLRTSHLLPAIIAKIHQAKQSLQKKVIFWGSGNQRREFMLSDDCADAMIYLMNHYSNIEPVNIGIGKDFSIRELVENVTAVIGVSVEVDFDSTKPEGILRKLADNSKLIKLGWHSKYSLREGIAIAYQEYVSRENKGKAA